MSAFLTRIRDVLRDFLREAVPLEEREPSRRGKRKPPAARAAPQLKSRHQKDVLGRRGEDVAARFLEREHKLHIRDRNVAFSKGELDIVAEDGTEIVFVEVKTRRSKDDGGPVAALTPRKQRTIIRLAELYLSRFHLADRPIRFDLVSIVWPDDQEPIIDYYRDAFDVPAQ